MTQSRSNLEFLHGDKGLASDTTADAMLSVVRF